MLAAQTFQTVTKNDGAGSVLLKDIADAGSRPVTRRLDQFHSSPLHSVVGLNVNGGRPYVPVSRQRLQHTNSHAFASQFGNKTAAAAVAAGAIETRSAIQRVLSAISRYETD